MATAHHLERSRFAGWRFTGWSAVLAVLNGCAGSAVSRGAEFYEQRRYIDAAQIFEHHEVELASYEAKERVRYALYRGATLLALGDHAGARQWLAYGERLGADGLGPEERTLLVQGLYLLRARVPQPSEPLHRAEPAAASISVRALPAGAR